MSRVFVLEDAQKSCWDIERLYYTYTRRDFESYELSHFHLKTGHQDIMPLVQLFFVLDNESPVGHATKV